MEVGNLWFYIYRSMKISEGFKKNDLKNGMVRDKIWNYKRELLMVDKCKICVY